MLRLPENSRYLTVKLPPETLLALDKRAMNSFARGRAEVARDLIVRGLRHGR